MKLSARTCPADHVGLLGGYGPWVYQSKVCG